MRLAERLHKTVRQLLDDLGDGELDWWLAKDRIEPGGQFREDLRAGIIASTVANMLRSSDSDGFSAADFLPPPPSLPAKEDEEFPDDDALADKLLRGFGIIRTGNDNG